MRPLPLLPRIIVTGYAIFPLIATAQYALSPLISAWPRLVQTLVMVTIVVPIAVICVVPVMSAAYRKVFAQAAD
ncbi:hypothetical protein [Microbacterium amylolyticum]|uniref:Antibiotic biosynthesis monooxygenase (ABM) superfamily enzyme n=1 Tax=Microbacterium amylolyticum TaxID=936337 RepID=A0ABS4ZFR4_9MICO|nr:hypothetical protein [Microbacterium amylolyticum]MBP2436115.1 antibiotic biosynthesis monooxygenase (ABM) superfamily enzyme [Microbacterium amylolyticum]